MRRAVLTVKNKYPRIVSIFLILAMIVAIHVFGKNDRHKEMSVAQEETITQEDTITQEKEVIKDKMAEEKKFAPLVHEMKVEHTNWGSWCYSPQLYFRGEEEIPGAAATTAAQ